MDTPPIQYAREEDGVSLAYWTLGERSNPAVVIVPWGVGHLSMVWQMEPFRTWYQRLARRFFLVTYDNRGTGMSQRDVLDQSLARVASDIETMASQVELDRYALFTDGVSGAAPAVVHATTRPEAVSHLLLWTPVDGVEMYASGYVDGLRQLRAADWETYRHSAASSWAGWTRPEVAEAVAAMLEKATTQEGLAAITAERTSWGVTSLLPSVLAKTLVIGVEGLPVAPLEASQRIAAAIPGARLMVADQSVAWPALWDHEAYAAAAEELIFGPADEQDDSLPPGFRTLLFTDLESSTALTQALGDAKAQEVLRGHNDAVRAALAAHGGEEVKHTGDGIFAAFSSAVSAVEASLQIQRELAGAEVRVRIGLNAGEPIAEDDDYFGAAVQLAARVCDRAEPGQVLVPAVVRDLCRGKTFSFEDQGEATLKGFPEPVRLFVVGEGA